MKKSISTGIAVIAAVVLAVLLFSRGGQEPEPAAVETGKEVVARILAPRPAPAKPVKLSVLEFETVEVEDEIVESEAAEAAAEAPVARVVPGVRLSPDQVLASVNGQPLTAVQLMPARRFKQNGTAVLPTAVLVEVLDRAIQRELLFQEADAQGVELGEREQAQLDSIYQHLTSSPLNLPEGQTVSDVGSEQDAIFHLTQKAARLLQVEFLRQTGEADTAESRLALRERLNSAANIDIVDLEPPQ